MPKKTSPSRRASSSNNGVFPTPLSVARLMVRVASAAPGAHVYDPVCGTGQLLLEAASALAASGGSAASLELRGQDVDPITVERARDRLAAAGVRATLTCGDSLNRVVHRGWGLDLRTVVRPLGGAAPRRASAGAWGG